MSEPAIVGIEASSKMAWFENMLFETGHKLFVGNPVLIRKRATSRHKNDRRDAELILELLMRNEFPAIWRRPQTSNQVIEIMGLRKSLVRQRIQCYNRLQALAHGIGMPKCLAICREERKIRPGPPGNFFETPDIHFRRLRQSPVSRFDK